MFRFPFIKLLLFRYQQEKPECKDGEEDDDDDYGFNKRPTVRGIIQRSDASTEVLQHQLDDQYKQTKEPTRLSWPLTFESTPQYNIPINDENNYSQVNELQDANLACQHTRPTSFPNDNVYKNNANLKYLKEVYKVNSHQSYSFVTNVGAVCTQHYESMKSRYGRAHSPPPLELSKNYHQTVVYIPYNSIDNYQQSPYYSTTYPRVQNQNQINQRFVEPLYQQNVYCNVENHYGTSLLRPTPLRPAVYSPYLQAKSVVTESQYCTTRSSQTPVSTMSPCNYCPDHSRHTTGISVPNDYGSSAKGNRYNYGLVLPNCPMSDTIPLTETSSQRSVPTNSCLPQPPGVNCITRKNAGPISPTKLCFSERGVPEGEASAVSSKEPSVSAATSGSVTTSPTSSGNTHYANQRTLFHAMNV